MTKHVATKTPYTKVNRNTLAALLRSRTKVIHVHGRTYNAGKNKAKRDAREATAYNKWFKASVQAAMNDPRPSLTNEEVEAKFAAKRGKILHTAK